MSPLAALWDVDDEVDLEFIIANPSSYTYLTPERYRYSCGYCSCNTENCTCDHSCTPPPYSVLGRPKSTWAGNLYPCYQWNDDRWPYGIGSFSDKRGRYIPYALRDGLLGVERARRIYPKLHVVYMVGQNDTCNDGLTHCDASCWKRNHRDVSEGESKCWRNHMDIRCRQRACDTRPVPTTGYPTDWPANDRHCERVFATGRGRLRTRPKKTRPDGAMRGCWLAGSSVDKRLT